MATVAYQWRNRIYRNVAYSSNMMTLSAEMTYFSEENTANQYHQAKKTI